jgi:uncharacterized membrane protein YgcG
MKYFFCTASSLLIFVVIALLPIGAAHAQEAAPFYWGFIHVEIDVQENGDMLVTETQKYVFTAPHTNERYRWLPLDKVDAIEDIAVIERGNPLSATSGVENNQLWIRWRHKLNAPESHTFVVKYRVIGGLHIDDAGDKVSWKAIFADRSAPVQSANVTVRLPPSLAGYIVQFNSFGASANQRQVDPRTVEITSRGALQPGKAMSVTVVFPHGLLDVPIPNWQRAPKKSVKGEDTNWFYWIIGIFIFLISTKWGAFIIKKIHDGFSGFSGFSGPVSSIGVARRYGFRGDDFGRGGVSGFGGGDGGGGDGGGGDGGGGGGGG